MFKLFNKGSKPTITDKIFVHTQNKWPWCQKILKENSKTIFIGWFDDTIDELETYFSQMNIEATVLKARTVYKSQIEGTRIVFIEHYPMKSKEDQLMEKLGLTEAVFLNAADEPLLKYFGGDKLIGMMEVMGMKDDPIEHKLITQSIVNAQKKIESKVLLEHSTSSQAQWIERNIK